jgi:hypothetical protein
VHKPGTSRHQCWRWPVIGLSTLAINDRGRVTGYTSVPTGIHNLVAFLYSHGRLINIDRRPTTANRYKGTAINNDGHVVGNSDHLSGFIYRGKRMESLNSLIAPKLGWDTHFPWAIREPNRGRGLRQRGVVLGTPGPDPSEPRDTCGPGSG